MSKITQKFNIGEVVFFKKEKYFVVGADFAPQNLIKYRLAKSMGSVPVEDAFEHELDGNPQIEVSLTLSLDNLHRLCHAIGKTSIASWNTYLRSLGVGEEHHAVAVDAEYLSTLYNALSHALLKYEN